MIRILKNTEACSEIKEVSIIEKGCWIDLSNPTPEEISMVINATRCRC